MLNTPLLLRMKNSTDDNRTPLYVQRHVTGATACLQVAKGDLQKIAASLSQAQEVYKGLKTKRAELNKAVEALQLMSEWQVRLLLEPHVSGVKLASL